LACKEVAHHWLLVEPFSLRGERREVARLAGSVPVFGHALLPLLLLRRLALRGHARPGGGRKSRTQGASSGARKGACLRRCKRTCSRRFQRRDGSASRWTRREERRFYASGKTV
jgi:hypothetical protein